MPVGGITAKSICMYNKSTGGIHLQVQILFCPIFVPFQTPY